MKDQSLHLKRTELKSKGPNWGGGGGIIRVFQSLGEIKAGIIQNSEQEIKEKKVVINKQL